MADVTVVGLQEIGAKLDKLFKDSAKKAIRKASAAGAEVYRREIRAKAPVRQDDYLKGRRKRGPGYLKKHIGRWFKFNQDGSLSVFVGPTKSAFYGRIVEKGHVKGNSPFGRAYEAEFGTANTPAHAFMRPAFDSQTEKAKQVFEEVAMAEIAKEIH